MKKIIFINAILTFALCFLTHFLYDWFPNPIFSILFPVNESIWEHMKMIYTTVLIYGIIEYFIYKKYSIDYNNFALSIFLKSTIAIPIYLGIYLPLYYSFGENMFITFTVLFLVVLLVNYIGYKIQLSKKINYQNCITIFCVIVVYVIMGILTYYPLKNDLFIDKQTNTYGVNIATNKK